MNAGRELDALVAEKVFGLHRNERGHWYDVSGSSIPCYYADTEPCDPSSWLPDYSTSIAAAWEVIERVVSGKVSENLEGFALTVQPGTIGASFSNLHGKGHFQSNGKTAPLAICLAALKAVGVDAEGEK